MPLPKLNVLLIDDDWPTNYYHEIILRENHFCNHIKSVRSASEALDYLRNTNNEDNFVPDLIFLDINLPGFNGFEFIDAYRELDESCKAKVIIMLSTSVSPQDEVKAKKYLEINDFLSKPLNRESLMSIKEKLL